MFIYIYLVLAATDTSVKLLQRRCSGMKYYTDYTNITKESTGEKLLQRRCSGMKYYTDYTNITKESTGEIPREVCPGIGEISCEV